MKVVRAAFLTAAVAVAALAIAGANPALALCKYGGPNCVNPRPNFDYQMPELVYLPDSNWIDPDCEYYGNCHY